MYFNFISIIVCNREKTVATSSIKGPFMQNVAFTEDDVRSESRQEMHYRCTNIWALRIQSASGHEGASQLAQMVKSLPAMQGAFSNPWAREIPWRREWRPTPVFLPGEFHGHRSLVGYSPWDPKELDIISKIHIIYHNYILYIHI